MRGASLSELDGDDSVRLTRLSVCPFTPFAFACVVRGVRYRLFSSVTWHTYTKAHGFGESRCLNLAEAGV